MCRRRLASYFRGIVATYTGLDLAPPPAAARAAAAARSPLRQSVRAAQALEHLHGHEREQARKNALRLAGGAVVVVTVAAVLARILVALRARLAPGSGGDDDVVPHGIAAGMAGLACLVALVTRRESRADAIEQFIDEGTRPGSGGGDNPLLRWIAIAAFVGMLLGAFLVRDAFAHARLRRRLAAVDRFRAADILAMLRQQTAGLDPRRLLRHGEDPLVLRETIAYLMTFRWADLSPQGDHLVLLSPARRRLLGDFDFDCGGGGGGGGGQRSSR